ncbi:hypothetical protein DFO70_102263 [Cytobacillus firmus]|uniref:Uncharacterized protein n=2 Tax=Cytobacillus TaxID=2675230 RepID=A0A366K2F6_CYTFI|nr:hypothetical protein DFO70_102263 [Cytobacillus firmus]TDX44849.1 hypothetical protein DFO72_103263 [Cytobacillus oceanisediminis]
MNIKKESPFLEDSFLRYIFDRGYSYLDWRARTHFLDSRIFCLKVPRLRTHFLGFILTLSEVAPSSDSFSQNLASSVRTCLDFGLNSSDLSLPCPKLLHLRTHSLGFVLHLLYSQFIFLLSLKYTVLRLHIRNPGLQQQCWDRIGPRLFCY